MKLIKNAWFLITILSTNIFAQTEQGFEISAEQNQYFDVSFTIYSLQNQIIKKVNSQLLTNLKTPEGLIQSHFSATNKKWVESNFLEPDIDKYSREQKHFDFIKKMNTEKNYIKLVDKYSFTSNGQEVAMILYLINYEGEKFKFPTVLTTIKKDNRWYLTNLPNQLQLNMVLLQIKPMQFEQLLLGSPTGNILTDTLIKNTRNKKNGLDILKLYEIMQNWNNNSEQFKHFINQ